jgi:hypothetical protein
MEFTEIPQLENPEPSENRSKRPRQRECQLSNRQHIAPNGPIIELESDTDVNNQQKTDKSSKKRKKVSVKVDLNKIADQLVLIPNAKPPGQSWIWSYFDQYEPIGQFKRIVRCLVQVQRKNGAEPCGHFMGSDNSTGNFITHLTTHRITEESHKRKMIEIRNNGQVSQLRIDEIIRNNPNIKSNRDRKFVGILIKDNRPISICNDEGFIEFIREFDPNYQVPSDKAVQQLLAEAYNQIEVVLTRVFNENILSCSITTDLWTARSRFGYIGVTCSFIDNDFKFCEAILSIKYVPYPHTGDNICKVIREIISNWNLNGKVLTMTTDNGSNMTRAGKLMSELTRLPCAAHTLQLVVGKGLLPAEVLIARAKRLINFFTTPKQTERLLEIQKSTHCSNNEVSIFNLANNFISSINRLKYYSLFLVYSLIIFYIII